SQRLIIRVGNKRVQKVAGVTERARELIERCERRVPRLRTHSLQSDIAQLTRERSMFARLRADDVDVLQAGVTIESQVAEVLTEKAEAFAKKKNRDQRQNDDRDQRVTAEECLDGSFSGYATTPRDTSFRQNRHRWGSRIHITRMRIATGSSNRLNVTIL